MRRVVASRGCFLICAAAMLFIGACARDDVAPADVEKQAFEDLRAEMREVIDDASREDEAVRLATELEGDLANLRRKIDERMRRVRDLNADYDTTLEEFESYLSSVEDEIRDNRIEVSKTHRAFRDTMTDEEFSAIQRSHTRAMSSAIDTIQAI